MLDPEKINFQEMGFRAGLEVHHQIVTKRKLFCNCKPILTNGEPDYRFERYFRPVLGEMGDFDEGMLIEYEKGYRVIYHAFEDSVCVYEQDEQPPFWPDFEAIYLGYELAHWLNCSALVDEVVVSRKQYLDGSITTGFQRTMIVGRDGWVNVNGKKIRISNLTVEEDAARKIKTENFGRTVYYNLDRLGIPLVEVITDHRDCDTPEDLRKLAEMIGLTLRISGIGMRGIGVVRQDVNISISGGDRVEIKGVQDLSMFEKIARREVLRQDMLIKIAGMLKKRRLKKEELEHTYFDFTDKFPREKIPKNYIIMAIRLPKFGGLLGLEIQPGKDFGQDIIEKAELISGVPSCNMFHSDEIVSNALRKLRIQKRKQAHEEVEEHFFFSEISEELNKEIHDTLKLKKDDAYVIALGPQKWVIHAMKKIIERAKMALVGVPQETRHLLPEGNTKFLRVIHGKDRLYPDTDTPPIEIDIEKVQGLKKKVGKRPWEIIDELGEKYGFTYEQITGLIRHNRLDNLLELINKYKLDPKRCYSFLEEMLVSLRRKGITTDLLSLEKIVEILKGAKDGLYDYSLIPKITELMIKNPNKNIKQVLSDLKVKKITEKDLERFFSEAVVELEAIKSSQPSSKRYEESKAVIARRLTGLIMRRAKGGISGQKVYNYVMEKMSGE